MFKNMVIRKTFIPLSSSALFTSNTVFCSSEKEEKKELIRPRDLSIYSKPKEEQKEKEKSKSEEPKTESKVESYLTSAVRQVRESVWGLQDHLDQVSEKVNHVIETGKAHTSTAIQTLREEDNYAQRYGAITMGGLVGYILALRHGKLRRLFNTVVGAAAVGAVCYPDEAKEYSAEGYRRAKRHIAIAYHLVNGVLRDYVGVQLPSLPGPLSIGSASAAERDGSTVPTSAALMPPPASTPSHIPASGPIPLPPIEPSSSVSDWKKKQGSNSKEEVTDESNEDEENKTSHLKPKKLSFAEQDPYYTAESTVAATACI